MIEPEDIKVGDILVLDCLAPECRPKCSRKSIIKIIEMDKENDWFIIEHVVHWPCSDADTISQHQRYFYGILKHWCEGTAAEKLEMII